jgi:RNA polymerase sigma-70 factor (ECF subfamily)
MAANDSDSWFQPLFRRVQAGDPAALDELFRHCERRLRALTRRMLRDFPDVQQWESTSVVFQEVVIRLLRTLREIEIDSAAGFLRLASQHIRWVLLDLSKKVRNEPSPTPGGSDDANPIENHAANTEDPYNLAVWTELHTQIEALPEEDRQLFDLLFYQGLSQPEAAEIIGMSLRTLKYRWQNLRIRLAEILGGESSF